MNYELKIDDRGVATVFPQPQDERGRLTLLLWHLTLLLRPSDAYILPATRRLLREPSAWANGRELRFKKASALMKAMVPTEVIKWDTPRNRALAIETLREAWQDIVIDGRGEPEQAADAVQQAEYIVASFPVAAASLVNETIAVLRYPWDGYNLLSKAARVAVSAPDHEIVRDAFANVARHVEQRYRVMPLKSLIPLANSPSSATSAPSSATPTPPADAASAPMFTGSQHEALERILPMGELFFDGAANMPNDPLRPRLFPLLAGPTGSGKSHLIGYAAKQLKAAYFRITRGDFTVQHARYGIPTIYTVIDLVATNDRVVFHLDELDKLTNLSGSEWSASICSDIYNIADKLLPIDEFLTSDLAAVANMAARKMRREEIQERLIKNLWCVGSGTWQSLFSQASRTRAIGFGAERAPTEVEGADIARAEIIAPELLARFNSEIVMLRYPEASEIEGMLERYGIRQLADELGIQVGIEDVKITGGIRGLESLKSRLLIERRRRERSVRPSVLRVRLPRA